mgnify:CR=1 FL=1
MEVSPYELKTALNEALQKGEVSITCIFFFIVTVYEVPWHS